MQKNYAAITFDIKGFFDNLDHHRLKRNWLKVLEKKELSEDEYKVYKNVVHYAYLKQMSGNRRRLKNKILDARLSVAENVKRNRSVE